MNICKDVDLVLASQSPRRRELLTQIGVRYRVLSVNVPEVREASEMPVAYVSRLARSKACAGFAAVGEEGVQAELRPESRTPVALGADTIVVLGEKVLEKPRDKQHSAELLSMLSGQTHEVLTAVSLCGDKGIQEAVCSTWVSFRTLSAKEIDRYWDTGESKDKAGAYGIQGFGSVFVKRIEGSYSNVVGLPLFETARLLAAYGVPVWSSYL